MATEQINGKLEEVTIVRPGVGTETVALAEGSTLGDLLRQAGVNASDSTVLIDGGELADQFVLKNGMVVTVVPRAAKDGAGESWRETVGMFKDDPAFEEMMRFVWAAREAERDAEHDDPC
jgi:sulfur carrier protein ThiS